MTTLLLCLFLGTVGAHRFYVGKIGSGIGQLLTMGGCGIWTLIDLIMILTGKFTDANNQPLLKG
jgi:TM2 domain-containing membrane protein YozV